MPAHGSTASVVIMSDYGAATRRIRIADDVAVVDSGDTVAVLALNAEHPVPLSLSGSGLDIWHTIDGSKTIDEIVDTIALHYGALPSEVRDDVVVFVGALAERGVVTAVSSG